MIAALAACGGKQQTGTNGAGSADPVGVVEDTRTPLEKRLDAACKALEPRIVECTVADARDAMAKGELSKAQYDDLTKPPILDKLAQQWDEKCDRRDRSSRQVRVLEVCFKEETECGPLMSCLAYVDQAPDATK